LPFYTVISMKSTLNDIAILHCHINEIHLE
jgi:hypothetical protein